MTEEKPVLVKVEDAICWISLNRPDKLNSMTLEMHEMVRRALDELAQLRRQVPRLQARCTELLEETRRLRRERDDFDEQRAEQEQRAEYAEAERDKFEMLHRQCCAEAERLLDAVEAAIDAIAAEYTGQAAWQIRLGHQAVRRVREGLG